MGGGFVRTNSGFLKGLRMAERRGRRIFVRILEFAGKSSVHASINTAF